MQALEQASLSEFGIDGQTVVSEIAEAIVFPDNKGINHVSPSSKELNALTLTELRNYVLVIASLYNDNPFHNFNHATHVAISVNKLLSQINAPDLDKDDATDTHDHNFGVGSDPLTWFACVFSALIHDVDHSGVPNAQLIKENASVAVLYRGKAVAEQNSFDISWDLLMAPAYANLRRAIYVNQEEFKKFRQLVVNVVMATDIMDKDLKAVRDKRWGTAFHELKNESESQARILKGTVIVEHLIQASDVAHTMQHWKVYRKWNEKFYKECYGAYMDGRAEADPTAGWYEGELGFFDFYVIPLAKKLKECGVFGVSSNEYLLYAQQNRMEWEKRGKQIVAEMASKVTEGD